MTSQDSKLKDQPANTASVASQSSQAVTPSATESTQPEQKLSRAERKRRATRLAIISATEQLIKTHPLDELTITEITDAADVGHGTFYLHFKSKYEVAVPIFHQKSEQWDAAIQRALGEINDPAVSVSQSARQIGRMMVVDPLCRWFLQHSGFPVDEVLEALGRFIARDIEKGLESGRFTVTDMDITARYLIGGVVSSLIAILDVAEPDSLVDEIAELMLRVLGVPDEEAREIAYQPLPDIPAG